MGSTVVTRTYKDCTPAELREWASAVQNEVARSCGEEYSGEWNMCHGVEICATPERGFENEAEVEDWLEPHLQKWEALLAVRVQLPTKKALTEKQKVLAQELAAQEVELHRQLRSFYEEALNAVRTGKSRFRTCPACKSSVAVQYLKQAACPVCGSGELVLTATRQKQLAGLTARQKRVLQKKQALQQQANSGPRKWVWVVSGMCAI